jgi:hypothetical protein
MLADEPAAGSRDEALGGQSTDQSIPRAYLDGARDRGDASIRLG